MWRAHAHRDPIAFFLTENGRTIRAKVRDSIFSYPEHKNNTAKRPWYTVTRRDGSVIRAKG